jgi:hypothetical protein
MRYLKSIAPVLQKMMSKSLGITKKIDKNTWLLNHYAFIDSELRTSIIYKEIKLQDILWLHKQI